MDSRSVVAFLRFTLLAGAVFVLPLAVWRYAYQATDWSALALLPLAYVVFRANYALTLPATRAERRMVLNPNSFLSRWFTGKIQAAIASALFALASVALLAWQTLILSAYDAALLIALLFATCLVFTMTRGFIGFHLNEPFVRPVSAKLATAVATIPFIFALAYTTHNFAPQSGPIADASLIEAIRIGLAELPDRSGWITQFVALPYVYEAAKLWIVVSLKEYPLAGWLFSLDAALFSFVLARAAVIVAAWLPSVKLPEKGSNHSPMRWFWGVIGTLCCLYLGLIIAGSRADLEKLQAEERPALLYSKLGEANQVALDAVRAQIGPALDELYRPVYSAIPVYAEFHYSVAGEYIELTEAAIGDLSSNMTNVLYDGFEGRLVRLSETLDNRFAAAFAAGLDSASVDNEGNELLLEEITQTAISDAKARVAVAAPIAGGTIVFGSKAVELAVLVVAKKLGAKALLKAGTKWGMTAAGAGSGAMLCAWTGPVAALCGATGAVIVWFGTDMLAIRLDEAFNRNEFEAELRALIDEDKVALAQKLELALEQKAIAVQQANDAIVQDFTLQQLSAPASEELCAKSTALAAEYSAYINGEDLGNEVRAEEIRTAASQLNLFAARDLRAEVITNLPSPLPRVVKNVLLSGAIPPEYASNRDVSGMVMIDGREIEFERTASSAASGFTMVRAEEFPMPTARDLTVSAVVQQHNYLANSFFSGTAYFDATAVVAATDMPGMRLRVPLEFVSQPKDTPVWNSSPYPGNGATIMLETEFVKPPELSAKLPCQ